MSTQFILHSKQRNYLLNIPSSQRKCESDQLQSTTEYRDRPNSIIHNIFSSAFIRSFILHPFNTLPTLREFVWSPPLRCTLYNYRVTLSEVTQSSCRDTRNPKNSTINLIPRHFPGCKNIPRASSVSSFQNSTTTNSRQHIITRISHLLPSKHTQDSWEGQGI